MSRIDEYDVKVTVDDVNLGTWDKLSGGEIDSEETTYKPGAMGSRISLGGSVNVGNLTVSVLYDLATIHSQFHWLASRAGKGAVTITKQPLDVDRNAVGRPIVYTGKLKMVTPPDVDSEASDAALLAIEVTPNGSVA